MEISSNPKKGLVILTITMMLSITNAQAANVVLDFEGVGDLAQVLSYYDDGTDGNGNFGKAYGVSFSNNARGIIDLDVSPDYHGNFANEPSGNTALILRESGVSTMNVYNGFKSTFSLFYSSAEPVSISIFDGLDGTGNPLATLTRGANVFFDKKCDGDKFGDFCHWDSMEIKFQGLAKSVTFGGLPEGAYFDDISIAPISEPVPTPIPGAFWLMGSALLGLFKLRRRTLAE